MATGPTSVQIDADEQDYLLQREMFERSRSAALLGTIPVALVAAAHMNALPTGQVARWAMMMALMLALRSTIAHLFLRATARGRGDQAWLILDTMISAFSGVAWGSMFWLLAVPEQTNYFYLQAIIATGAATYVFSSLGLYPLNYAVFLVSLLVPFSVALNHTLGANGLSGLPLTLQIAGVMYFLIMFVRAFEERRRTRDQIRSRLELAQANTRLQAAILEEKKSREALQQQHEFIQRINDQLTELTVRDSLTGIHNRRFLTEMLTSQTARAQRYGDVLTLAMIDVDHFKAINDTYGHSAGDEVLCRIAGNLPKALRLPDICGRWGGEEFLCLLLNTGLEDSKEVAERIRRMVAADIVHWHGQPIPITLSIGLAEFCDGDTIDSLLERADRGLYMAKSEGRNRVMWAERLPAEEAGGKSADKPGSVVGNHSSGTAVTDGL